MAPSQQEPSAFSLNPGERIVDCCPLWTSGSDRMLQELANCHYCPRPTYRVITVATVLGLERRAALCSAHYAAAARAFPELERRSA